MKLIVDIPDAVHMALCRSKFLNLPITSEQSAIAEGTPLDDVVAKIEQAANKQTLVALGCSDISECQDHLRTSAAYTHCLQILNDAMNKDKYMEENLMIATSFATILMNDQYEYCWETGNYEDQCCDLCPHASECSGNEHADDD